MIAQGKKDMNWNDLMFENGYNPSDAYYQSKLGNILFNLELSKRVKGKLYTCRVYLQLGYTV